MPSKKSFAEQLEEDYQNLTPDWKGSQKPENLRSNLGTNRNPEFLQPKSTPIQKFMYVLALQSEFPEIPVSTVLVYSYMLCKYMWFHQQGKMYFESQVEIARNLNIALNSVKRGCIVLEEYSLLSTTKLKGAVHNKNSYELKDKYKVYDYLKKQKGKVLDYQGEY